MKTIKETIDYYKKQGITSTDKHLCEVIEIIEEQYIDPVKESHPDIHWDTMREIHEVYCGPHYDEAFAKYEVEHMHHKGTDGMEYKGQYWSMEQVQPVYAKHKPQIKGNYNVYDFYVTCHMILHDNISMLKKWYPTESDEVVYAKIFEMTVNWLNDDDYTGSGKIWEYLGSIE